MIKSFKKVQDWHIKNLFLIKKLWIYINYINYFLSTIKTEQHIL